MLAVTKFSKRSLSLKIILHIIVIVNYYFQGDDDMYECQDCGHIFEVAAKVTERHGLDTPPFEEYGVCPACSSQFFRKAEVPHCRCCGARLPAGITEYCNETCRKRGTELRMLEEARMNQRRTDPLHVLVRQIDEYNRIHNTRYSYGQYVALILPRLKGKKKRDI